MESARIVSRACYVVTLACELNLFSAELCGSVSVRESSLIQQLLGMTYVAENNCGFYHRIITEKSASMEEVS